VVTGPPSFVLDSSSHVRFVDWIIPASGYRTYLVGERIHFGESSRLYCPSWMTNIVAGQKFSLCTSLPPMFSSEEWQWRRLDDFTTHRRWANARELGRESPSSSISLVGIPTLSELN